jgi:hypothetical protein
MGAHSLVRADAASIESNVVVETFLRFKGLERPAIIVTDLRLARERSDYGKRMYIALTRATTAVRIVDDKDTIAADPILARLMQK